MFTVNINEEETEVVLDEKENKGHRIKQKICSATPLIATATYLLLGFCFDLWHPGWVIFLAIPVVPMVLFAFNGSFKKNFISILTFVLIVGYLVVGVCFKIWHPTWIAFFLIPIFSIFLGK